MCILAQHFCRKLSISSFFSSICIMSCNRILSTIIYLNISFTHNFSFYLDTAHQHWYLFESTYISKLGKCCTGFQFPNIHQHFSSVIESQQKLFGHFWRDFAIYAFSWETIGFVPFLLACIVRSQNNDKTLLSKLNIFKYQSWIKLPSKHLAEPLVGS